MTDLLPISREILVESAPPVAFTVFTDQIGTWWPLAELSVHGRQSSVAFVDGVIVESAPGRPDAMWGTVTAWEPPSLVAFTWHPGRSGEHASQVTVTFTASGDRTLVRLEHAGWEHFDDPAAARAEYDSGWPAVLSRFGKAVLESSSGDDDTWVALMHRPAEASAPGTPPVFEDPRFADHVAFLSRMRAAGYLVAAGPMPDEPGAGMTILRLPGADRLGEATRLATVDDASIGGGLLTVTVRPWQVVLQA